jgi:tRNA(fMet)-specific endonuclease VapC
VSLKYLLDTNIISEPLRPKPNAKVLARLKRHGDEVALPSIVWHELWFGCERLPVSAKRTAIEEYLTKVIRPSMPILPYDEWAAVWHANERVRLASQGKTPPFADGQIIAIAKANELILVTLNSADYSNFREVEIEDWSK